MTGLFGTIRGVWTAFRQSNLIPRQENNFNDNAVRLSRYQIFAAYVDNEIYSSSFLASAGLKVRNNLYTNIRAIMNMTGRVVDLFVYYVYVGNIDMEHLTAGAIPIVSDDDSLKDAIIQLFRDSNWNSFKDLYVRNGATFGDSAIKVIDDRETKQVYLEVLDPNQIVDIERDNRGNITSIAIEYERDEELDIGTLKLGFVGRILIALKRKTYTYTEIITSTRTVDGVEVKGMFSTYKDGKPFAFYRDMNGNLMSEWPNEYDKVPVVIAQHTKTNLKWGANSFYKVLHKIDELNDEASILKDQIRKSVIAIFVALGVKKKDMEVQADDRDKVPMLFFPTGSDIKPLQTQLDIAAVNGDMDRTSNEILADLPILAFQQIRESGGDLTQPGVEAAYSDGIASVTSARANYDTTLTMAIKIALEIAGYNGYQGYQGFNLGYFNDVRNDFSIKGRPVITVGLSVEQRITLLSSVGSMTPALQKVALREMGYADDVIDEIEQGALEAQANAVRGLMQGVFDPTGANGGSSKPQLGQGEKQPVKMLPAPQGG